MTLQLLSCYVFLQKPILICREGEFRRFLEENVPLLSEHYWPTPWCVESRLQTVLGSVLRSRLLPAVKYRRYNVHTLHINIKISSLKMYKYCLLSWTPIDLQKKPSHIIWNETGFVEITLI